MKIRVDDVFVQSSDSCPSSQSCDSCDVVINLTDWQRIVNQLGCLHIRYSNIRYAVYTLHPVYALPQYYFSHFTCINQLHLKLCSRPKEAGSITVLTFHIMFMSIYVIDCTVIINISYSYSYTSHADKNMFIKWGCPLKKEY